VSTSLTIALAAMLFGALMLYAGWTGRSVRRLLVGDSTPGTGS
jgi:hypothetical protein